MRSGAKGIDYYFVASQLFFLVLAFCQVPRLLVDIAFIRQGGTKGIDNSILLSSLMGKVLVRAEYST
jgi:hypothetical protein